MRIAACALALLATAACSSVALPDRAPTTEAALPGGAVWSAIVPGHWNGTLLLHSRGYAPTAGHPQPAPDQYRGALLARGYALAASNYGSGGWALAEAVPAQEATIAAFSRRYGQPKRVIAYGFSMGGLVTTALAERPNPSIDGALALCGSIGGTIGMMNMGLDGAFAFKTLLAPESAIELVGVTNDRANGALAQAVAEEARKSRAGRARLVLAATLAGIPAWVPENPGEDASEKIDRQVEALLNAFPGGVFLPRAEQEQRAGVGYSWNAGVDYSALLAQSQQEEFVRAVYRTSGLNLDADLERLDRARRISPEPDALAYMSANYVPTGKPNVPLLAVQNLGDVVTSPSLQQAYGEIAPSQSFRSLYLAQQGHCAFSERQFLQAINVLEERLAKNQWRVPSNTYSDVKPSTMLRATPSVRH